MEVFEDASETLMAETGEVLENASEIEILLGYTFRRPSLLTEALTHGSYSDHYPSYNSLEFVGDAVLGLAITRFLYFLNPTLSSGVLSDLRSANVSTEKLARAAVHHDLYRFLRRKSPDLDRTVYEFTKAVKMERMEDAGELSFGGHVCSASKVLADIVESIAAAVYIDCKSDLDEVWKVFRKILKPIITSDNFCGHPVTDLNKAYQQKKQGRTPQYNCSIEDSLWVARATFDGEVVGTGYGTNKKIAIRNAARGALRQFEADFNAVAEEGVAEGKNFPRNKLNQLCKKNNWKEPEFKKEKEEGPPHCRRFTFSVHIEIEAGKIISAYGSPESKQKTAQQSAASNMLSEIASGFV